MGGYSIDFLGVGFGLCDLGWFGGGFLASLVLL